MIIGFFCLEIYLPYCHSIKEKRKRIQSLKHRLIKRYNIAFAELDYQNKWQRSKIGLVTLNNHKSFIEKTFHQILQEVERNIDGEIINQYTEYY